MTNYTESWTKEKELEYQRRYRRANYAKRKETQYKWIDRNRDRFNRKSKEWKRRHRVSVNMGHNIYLAIKEGKSGFHWESLVNYTLKDLMQHITSQFNPKMNWNNYGDYWEIDHIIPQCFWQFNSPQDREFKQCWALCNLRPLEKTINRMKINPAFCKELKVKEKEK